MVWYFEGSVFLLIGAEREESPGKNVGIISTPCQKEPSLGLRE